MPQPHIIHTVCKAVRRTPGYPSLKILDLSCGEGEILAELHQDGCYLEGSHFRSDDWIMQKPKEILKKIPIHRDVDLTGKLPFPDESFDIVILSEVLEHLPTHQVVVREVGRILRPEGRWIVSTPNIFRLHSRLQFLFTGTHKLIQRPVGWDLKIDDLYAYHINPVDFPLFHTLLHQARLSVTDLRFSRFRWKYAGLFFLFPLIWLGTRLAIRSHRKKPQAFHQGMKDLFRWMIHPAMLGSEQLLIIAKRN